MLRLVAEGRVQGQVNPNLSDEALRVYFRAFMDVFIDPQLQRRFASRRGVGARAGVADDLWVERAGQMICP